MLAPSGGGLILYQAYGNLYAMTDKKENKRKRPAIDDHSDYEDAVVMKEKGKNKEKDNTIVECIPEVVITNEPKSILLDPLKKNLADKVTAKWRDIVKNIVHKKNNTINITKLEQHLVDLSKCDMEFNLGFLVLFLSIFGLGNKDGNVNDRIIPFLTNTDDVSQMDWCSYALESMVRGCKEYKQGKYFSGPMLLMVIIYVNSTVSEIVKVEKTVLAFMSWNSNLMLKREQEEIELGGFGRLPIVKGLQEMKDILRQNLVKCNKLMVDTDSKLKIALSLNPEDKELKKIIEERNNLFLDFYKEEDNNGNVEGEEKDGDKNGNTNETECDTDLEEVEGNKDECEEDKGNEEQQETNRKLNEDESQNEAEHNESDNIDNIGNLSLSAGQNTTINTPVESTVNAIVESTDNVVDVLPQICVDAQKEKKSLCKRNRDY
ncbi:hypothetical protein Tco_1067819 [Tanacetum coccineum]|uniref:FRIGIDA-like protein n=1 Tax=Tanacetum coccineum TaxID=301880 RepID=A0ABQ5HDZ0_9ASTR